MIVHKIYNFNKWYNKNINYFELQYAFVSNILTDDIAVNAYQKGKILTPTIIAINSFHKQFTKSRFLNFSRFGCY